MTEEIKEKIPTISFSPEELERIFTGFFQIYVSLCEMNMSELECGHKKVLSSGLIGNKDSDIEQIHRDFILKTYAIFFQEKDILAKYKSLIEFKEPIILN